MFRLKQLKKDVLVEAAYSFSSAQSISAEEFSRVFDSENPKKNDEGYTSRREKWVHLIDKNSFPNDQTRQLIFNVCSAAEKIYKSQFWNVLTRKELSKYQLLKVMKLLPSKYQRYLRLENKNIRKKYVGFNLPSNLAVKDIYHDFTVDAFAACFVLFRYELKHNSPCFIIYQQYEVYALRLFIALMAQEPFYKFRKYFIRYFKNQLMSNLCSTGVDSIIANYSFAQLDNTIGLFNKNINLLKNQEKLKCDNDFRMFSRWWFEANISICHLELLQGFEEIKYAPPQLKGNNWIIEQMNKQRAQSRQITLLPF